MSFLGLSFPTTERERGKCLPFCCPTRANRSQWCLGWGSWQGREAVQGALSYLRGLARRQVKKHSRPKASSKRRRLRTAVRTASRVGDRSAILGQRGPSDAASTTLYTPGHT